MFLRILAFVAPGLQVIGAFLLASQLIPKRFVEGLAKILAEKKAKLSSKRISAIQNVQNGWRWRPDYQFVIGIRYFLVFPFCPLFALLVDQDRLKEQEENRRSHSFGSEFALIWKEQRSFREWCDFCLVAFTPTILFYATLAWLITYAHLPGYVATWLYVKQISWVLAWMYRQSGGRAMALLGIVLLIVGFILQAAFNWATIR